jgi:toxin FitB
MYLLDTNVLSALRRRDRMDANLRHWAESVLLSDQYLSVISIMEIELGILRVERRDAAQAAVLRRWFDGELGRAFADRILPITDTIARRCAALHVPDPKSERDAYIAATALEHRFAIVTRNVADFAHCGVEIVNPWEDGGG